MCGIAGIISQTESQNPELVISMRDTLRHRGPDDSGLWQSPDRTTILAHQRLAIIDLSPAGHQPMQDASGRLTIVHNGEIYNFLELRDELESSGHRFRTHSDTEVILEAYRCWGERFVEHLNGMFSFAIYDTDRDILFAARDRAGEKPMFYWHNGNTLIFVSELKALMKHPDFPRRLDPEAMNFYLAYGYVPWDMCILQGVKKLPQGHTLMYERKNNRLTTRAYWSLPEPQSTEQYNKKELVDELEGLLTSAVRRQLIADVPVGILLSGGIDSSLITAIAARISDNPVKTFTISFPGDSSHDEAPFAKIIADHFGTEHTVLPASEVPVDLLPKLAGQYDEPLADSSMIPTFLVSQLIRQHATVAIGGDGGDELFAGYPHFPWLLRQEMARKFLPAWARTLVARSAEAFMPIGLRGRSYIMGLEGDLQNSFAFINKFFDCRTRNKLFQPFHKISPDSLAYAEQFKAAMKISGRTMVQKATAVDFMTYLADDILVKVDRASMFNSLEVRAPFLDHNVIEFAFSKVPDSLRVNDNGKKILPRLLAQKLLPGKLDLNRKQGFAIPLAQWFKGEWGDLMKSILLSGDTWFDRTIVKNLIDGQENGLVNTQRLYSLMLFELWRKNYNITL